MDFWIDLYTGIGYRVFLTSVTSNIGIDQLKSEIKSKVSLFFGHSGVGKSSLLNIVFPGFNLATGNVSTFTVKGTHTTVTATMLKTDIDTYVIDTPGIREIEPFGVSKENLGHYYIEFTKFSNNCRFNTCTHSHEPGCAVITAVDDGLISTERYESYLRLLETVETDIHF